MDKEDKIYHKKIAESSDVLTDNKEKLRFSPASAHINNNHQSNQKMRDF